MFSCHLKIQALEHFLDEISDFVIAGLEASMLLDAKLKLCPIMRGLFSVFNNFSFAQKWLLHKSVGKTESDKYQHREKHKS